jgi:hypothetical protein
MIEFLADCIVVMGLISITMCSFAVSYFVTDKILTYFKRK